MQGVNASLLIPIFRTAATFKVSTGNKTHLINTIQ